MRADWSFESICNPGYLPNLIQLGLAGMRVDLFDHSAHAGDETKEQEHETS